MKNLNEENVKKLIEGAKTALMMTDKGLIAVGSTTDLLFLYSEIARLLSQNKISKEALSYACKIGLEENYVEKEKPIKEIKELKKFISDLNKLLEEFGNE